MVFHCISMAGSKSPADQWGQCHRAYTPIGCMVHKSFDHSKVMVRSPEVFSNLNDPEIGSVRACGSDDSLSCRENVTEHGSSSSKAAARTHSPCLWLTWGTLRAPPLLCPAPRSLSPAAGLSQRRAWVRRNSVLMIPKRKTSTGVAAEH